jgi:hypothetical protein
MRPGYGRGVRRARLVWRIPLAVALVALPLAGLYLLGSDRGGDPASAGDAAVLQPATASESPAEALLPSGGTTDPARLAAATRVLGLVAVLVAMAGVAVVAAGRCALPVTAHAGRPGRRARPAGRGPPLLPR